MNQDRTRKIIIAGALGAIAALLGVTPLGFIPWITGISLTIMHIPAIVGAVLEGPWVGLTVGLIFGASSMMQAIVAPRAPTDVVFANPLLSVLPRLFIGPVAWAVWHALKERPKLALPVAGVVGSLTNTVLVLGMFGLLGLAPWGALAPIAVTNGLPEAIISAILVLVIVAAWRRIRIGQREGADL